MVLSVTILLTNLRTNDELSEAEFECAAGIYWANIILTQRDRAESRVSVSQECPVSNAIALENFLDIMEKGPDEITEAIGIDRMKKMQGYAKDIAKVAEHLNANLPKE